MSKVFGANTKLSNGMSTDLLDFSDKFDEILELLTVFAPNLFCPKLNKLLLVLG